MPNLLRVCCLFGLLLLSNTLGAQSCCEIKRDAGQAAFAKGDFLSAIIKWTEGKGCSDTNCADFVALVGQARDALLKAQEQEKQAAADDAFWEALQDGDIADCDKYLKKYPAGKNAAAASQRRELLSPKKNKPSPVIASDPGKPYRDCPECPLMVPIEGGTFMMGDASGEKNECPHSETVSSFSLGQFEVTVGEYLLFADTTKSHYPEWLEKNNIYNVEADTSKNPFYKDKGYSRNAKNLPICGISWDDAVAYCEWLTQKTGKKYRLPLENEFEFAAKGGKKSMNYKYSGSNTPQDVAWHSSNSGAKPHPVGSKAANELGLFDVSGNLWEWCEDRLAAYPGCTAEDCSGCVVLRGGSWSNFAPKCRNSTRYWLSANYRDGIVGFRCARD